MHCPCGSTSFKKVTHVIFDLDGLLIDSETINTQVINEIAHSYGKEYTLDMKMKLLGSPEKVTARIVVEEMQLPITPEKFAEIFKARCIELFTHVQLMPGAEKLVRHFHKHRIPIAVATSSSQEGAAFKTRDYKELFNLFHHIVAGGSDPEVKKGKPAPDIFLICASRFPDKPKPQQCLVLEDAPNGIRGATAAGMQTVMVPAKEVAADGRKEATLVLESLLDFKPELFALPAMK